MPLRALSHDSVFKTISTIHRCLLRHGISLLPNMETDKPSKKTPYPVDFLHLDIVEVQTAEGKLSPLAALERN